MLTYTWNNWNCPWVRSRISIPPGVLQVWWFDSADLEPQWEQHERLHAAGAAALHPGRGAGRAQQQGRDIAGLERKCPGSPPGAARKSLPTPPHAQIVSDSSGVLCGSTWNTSTLSNIVNSSNFFLISCSQWNKYCKSCADLFYLKFSLCSLS